MTQRIGRKVAATDEVADLQPGLDFREPRYRREVFLRFYEFHLRYRSHPGCVYYLLPELAKRGRWTAEQKLWFAFINGCTQNPVTSWFIFREFPELAGLDEFRLASWFREHYPKLAFDTDRRYFKKSFLECVAAYRPLVDGSQKQAIESVGNFGRLWAWGSRNLRYFGRLSLFSYLEYLSLSGIAVECDTLFLDDIAGSRSHRNGLCKVLGRDDLDWHDSNPQFDGGYAPATLAWLKVEAAALLKDAQKAIRSADVGYFTLESTLCTYKSWHRPNRRYPNVYNDMLVERIRHGERAMGERLDVFWGIRRDALPAHLRLEDNPTDPGLVPEKQNHYLRTGQVIMMDVEWPCFRNDFNDRVRAKEGG